MKKFLWFITIAIIASACSKDDDEKFISEEIIEVYQNAFEDAANFVARDAFASMGTAIDYIKNLDGVTAVIEEDSIVRVTTQGNVQFSIDFNIYPDYEIGNVDFGALQHYEDSINNAIGGIASGYEQTSEVFSDYIASVTQQDENTTTATRAASPTTIRLSRRNFVIWSPYTRSDFIKEKEDVIKVVKRQTSRCGETTIFSPTSFTELGNYDVVFFSSHGGKDGSFFLPDDCLSENAAKEYGQEMSKERGGVERASRIIGNKRVKGYCLRENFFNNHLPNLSHTVIYTSACYFGADNCVFRKCCEAKDVADYFGSDNACIGADVLSAFAEFYPKLMNGASTKMAFKNGRSYFTGALLRGKNLETFKFKRFGKKTVSYAIPHASGVGSRSNARTRADGNEGSQTIVNAQLRYSSEETDDILKSIEAGICLQDMKTKEVTLIPFSDKNIVSNEKKAYGDVNVSNIAVSLDDLTEGHQYAYCCYTKVDGLLTLSDECYNISDSFHLVLKYSWTSKTQWYYKYSNGQTRESEENSSSEELYTFHIYKINGTYFISKWYLPSQLHIDNSKEKYSYPVKIYTSGVDDGMLNGSAQCLMVNDYLHIKWSATETGTYNSPVGYDSHEIRDTYNYDIEVKQLLTTPISSMKRSFTLEWFYSDRYVRAYDDFDMTFIGYEKSTIPQEMITVWDSESPKYCRLIRN